MCYAPTVNFFLYLNLNIISYFCGFGVLISIDTSNLQVDTPFIFFPLYLVVCLDVSLTP